MAKYLKNNEAFINNEMVFKLTTKESIEKFSLWDNLEKKFVKENTEVTLEKGPQTVSKYIKLSDKDKTRYARSVKFTREIVFKGENVLFDFPMSVDKEIGSVMSVLEGNDINPLTQEWVVTKIPGSIPLETRYTVASRKAGKSLSAPEVDFDLDVDELVLSSDEQTFIDKVLEKYAGKVANTPQSSWVDLMTKKLGTDVSRAKRIVSEKLFNGQ